MKTFLTKLTDLFSGLTVQMQGRDSAELGFDTYLVEPFLLKLNAELRLNLDVAAVVEFIQSLPQKQEGTFGIDAEFCGVTHPVIVTAEREDALVYINFYSPCMPLGDAIQAELTEFFTVKRTPVPTVDLAAA